MRSNYKAKYPVQTVERAIEILIYLRENASFNGLSLNQISAGLGLGKSTIHRFLDTLLEYDLVEKTEDGLSYKLGWGIFELGSNIPKFNGIDSDKISLHLKRLSNHFGEIINLGIKNSNSMIIIKRFFPEEVISNYKLITNVNVGEREPLHSTGIGKLFLSEIADKEIISIFRMEKIKKSTIYTICDEENLLKEIANVRKNGYALDDRESSLEIFCIAVPIRDYTGDIVAGISISVPVGRIPYENIGKVAQEMKEKAVDISKALGYV